MKAIFTIISYNYLPLAWTLMDSVSKLHSFKHDLFIVVADANKNDLNKLIDEKDYPIIYLSGEEILDNKNLTLELAFKYDVTEFCTSLKPFTFLKLSKTKKYSGITYFDPDFYIYTSISDLYKVLSDKLCIVTPHYYQIEDIHTGFVSEKIILFAGIFNFGFFALNPNHKQADSLLNWWSNRLINGAYHDKIDAYHTDQKWMDFLPTYFGEEVFILRKPGYNLAIWNLHQRILKNENNKYTISDIKDSNYTELSFIHFAGFDYYNTEVIHKHFLDVTSDKFPVLKELMLDYKECLKKNGFEQYINMQYKFNFFENNMLIIKFHRRLFRAGLDNNIYYENPFSCANDSFYAVLKKKKMLVTRSPDKLNEQNFKGIKNKLGIINRLFKIFKSIIGFEKYSLFIKFLARYSRYENQYFLLDGTSSQYYVNENRNIPANKTGNQ